MPRASEIFPQPGDGRPLSDRHFTTNCPQCNRKQNLEEAAFTPIDESEFHYLCASGCGPVLVISTHGAGHREGRGYRLRDWVVRNPRVLWVAVVPGKAPIFMPASPDALD